MWACELCTLEQSDKRQTCAACNAVRPDLTGSLGLSAAIARPGGFGKRPRDTGLGIPTQLTDEECLACFGKHRPHTCGLSREARKAHDILQPNGVATVALSRSAATDFGPPARKVRAAHPRPAA